MTAVPGSFSALVEWFLPPALRAADADTVRRAKLCVAYNLAVPVWAPAFALLLWSVGQPLIGALIALGVVVTPVPLLVLRSTGSLALAGHVMAGAMFVLTVGCTWLEGGLGAPGVVWFPLAPLLAMLIAGRGAGIAWGAAFVAALVGYHLLARLGLRPELGVGPDMLSLLHLALASSAIVLGLVFGVVFESLKADALRSLEQANQALARARDQAEAATRAKSDFLASMSHEIRTPIHGIFGMTELALDTSDDGERREFLHRSRACAETLLAIINDILDFSRIEAGKLVLEHADFDPRHVLDGVLDTLASQAAEKGLELVGRSDDEVPVRLRGDAGRLRQVLVNLVGNAVKFTARGEVTVGLELDRDAAADGAGVVLCGVVRDTGIGIAPDQLERIFEAFAQAAGESASARGGTGLGLAITQRLVTLMGGEIVVESEPGLGSTFRFRVRVAAAVPADLSSADLSPGVELAGLRILVVEPNASSRAQLVGSVRSLGAEAVAVADPGEVAARLDDARGTAFDAVVMDVPRGEPARDAWLRQLQRMPATARAPLVALVTRRRASPPPCLPAGAVAVSKPVKSGALATAFDDVLRAAGAERRVVG